MFFQLIFIHEEWIEIMQNYQMIVYDRYIFPTYAKVTWPTQQQQPTYFVQEF